MMVYSSGANFTVVLRTYSIDRACIDPENQSDPDGSTPAFVSEFVRIRNPND